ncbi:hypothetical protein [Bacillus sp. ISL-39]|uniref:hypothetical protein n=1 Tax=Bacillus sp. ISL-39 TaxID=2819124 RepID=UPI001BE71A24|nr:hypothetical protein [Bacillus sp. ISL-39]MBT2638877.1 hypothetical protein [Bacillus sp. ISL-39]
MSKKLLTFISGIFLTVTLVGSFIWVFSAADENGRIQLEGNENYVYLMLLLGIIGFVTGSIALKATNEEGDTISKKTVFFGLALAAIFFLWRLSVTL